ncbi:MAG: DUF547 domain-containing protein [Pseudomonadota bacterium]
MDHFMLGTVRRFLGKRLSTVLLSIGLAALIQPASATTDNVTLFSAYATLLEAHVQDGNVDYDAFAASDDYASMLKIIANTALPDTLTKAERLATHINAYNVLSIQGILDGYSPSSVFSRLKFFKRRQYRVFGDDMTLYELEHERIINEGDPRIHFAIVCSSKSCPPLIETLYLPETLDAQLDAVTRAFINAPQSNRFDRQNNRAELSRIFKWYRDEFAATSGSLAKFLATYIEDPALAKSLREEEWDFDFLSYDWSLNGTFTQ